MGKNRMDRKSMNNRPTLICRLPTDGRLTASHCLLLYMENSKPFLFASIKCSLDNSAAGGSSHGSVGRSVIVSARLNFDSIRFDGASSHSISIVLFLSLSLFY